MKRIPLMILLLGCFCGLSAWGDGDEQEELAYLLFQPNLHNKFINEEQTNIELKKLAENLLAGDLTNSQILVYGYAADVQNGIDPDILSKERAAFIINELQKHGLSKDLFSEPVGHGAVKLWGDNSAEDYRKPNRRVRILVSKTPPVESSPEVIVEENSSTDIPRIAAEQAGNKPGGFPWWILLVIIAIGIIYFVIRKLSQLRLASKTMAMAEEKTPSPPLPPDDEVEVEEEEEGENIEDIVSQWRNVPRNNGEWRRNENGQIEFYLDLNHRPKRFNYWTEEGNPRFTMQGLLESYLNYVENGDKIIQNLPESKRTELKNKLRRMIQGKDGIPFTKTGEIDFSKISIMSEKIVLSGDRYGSGNNMDRACEEMAKKSGMTKKEFIEQKDTDQIYDNSGNKPALTLHEGKDGTIDLIPHMIHANYNHDGGVSEQNNKTS